MKRIQPNGITYDIKLEESDIELAIRAFICACHPDLATGFAISPKLKEPRPVLCAQIRLMWEAVKPADKGAGQ